MKTKVGYFVSEIGVPEVDRVIQGSMFAGKTTISQHVPKKFTDIRSPKFQRRRTSVEDDEGELEVGVGDTHSSNKIIRDKNIKEDRISDLPDEILQFIVPLLTMREGAATSILSRRWRNLWSTTVSCYNFDLSNMTGYNYLNHDFRLPFHMVLKCERYLFTRWVNQVLELHRAPKINALRISFVLGEESASQINRWIKHAASQGLTQLELDFELFDVVVTCAAAYEFPFQLFASLKYLRLNCCYFNYPPNFKGFDSLVSLTLRKCNLPVDGLQNILSSCSVLESLSLLYCYFDGFIDNVKFSGPCLPLKHLCLLLAAPDAISKIEVHDVNLLSLEYNGSISTISIKNTPHLARLVLSTRKPVEILSDIPRLETLFFTPRVKVSVLPKLYVFSNLKRLVFLADGSRTNLVEAIYLLKACPFLQKLELDMSISSLVVAKSLTSITTRHGAPHGNLKEVEIYGFQDHLEKVELVVYLLRNAVVLEKMTIFSISKTYLGNGEWNLLEETVKQPQMRLKEVWKLLQKEARPSTKLVFCPHE